MIKFFKLARRLRKDEDGATAIEYGLLAALIAVAIITTLGLLGTQLDTTFSNVEQELVSANTPTP
jgi:pilus assembly protein Flp/PilA